MSQLRKLDLSPLFTVTKPAPGEAKVESIAELRVEGSAAGNTAGTIVKKVQIFDEDGVSLGYLAIYDAVTTV